MKNRLLVMNGQRIFQIEEGGMWRNEKVDKAGLLKPGIYNLYLAGSAERFGCRECQRLTYESRRNHRNKFWEVYHKHEDYVERAYRKYKRARGRKAKERRARLLSIAERRACFGDALIARMLRW